MPTSIWNKETGEELVYDLIDAKEVLRSNPDLYTKVDPNPLDPDAPRAPRNVTDVESEYRREPMGINPQELPSPREVTIIRNATGAPRLR